MPIAETNHPVLPCLARIADFDTVPFDVAPLPRDHWRNGQYIVCRVCDNPMHRNYEVELRNGRVARLFAGDHLIGVLGRRSATLQVVGSWEAVEPVSNDQPVYLDLLSIAGVMGKCTSRSPFAGTLAPLHYLGHALRGGRPVAMSDFATHASDASLNTPVILIVGTSMDAGKTLAAARLIRILTKRGLKVAASKLTGVGRYRDVLAMRDAGAQWILDFVDAGLPSTVVPADEFEQAVTPLLARIGALGADVVVMEAGASPLEPYNGDTAVRLLGDRLQAVVLCASDPYAALGVMQAFDLQPSFIAGRATVTTAGAALTASLTGRPVVNLLAPEDFATAERILAVELNLDASVEDERVVAVADIA